MGVKVQLLQTLSILIQNIDAGPSVFYLLSNDHINELIRHRFDFAHEEILAQYVSLLKAIALRLDGGKSHLQVSSASRISKSHQQVSPASLISKSHQQVSSASLISKSHQQVASASLISKSHQQVSSASLIIPVHPTPHMSHAHLAYITGILSLGRHGPILLHPHHCAPLPALRRTKRSRRV